MRRLLLAGPTPVPAEVRAREGMPMVDHYSQGFLTELAELRTNLGRLADCRTEDVAILPSSGTGGLEAAVQNLLERGDRVLVVVAGLFGERFFQIAQRRGLEVVRHDVEYGAAFDSAEIVRLSRQHDVKAVLLTQNETSTGVLQPVEDVSRAFAEGGPLVVVDAISGFPSVPLHIRADGIDCAIACSQKGFMTPPGLSILLLSQRAAEKARQTTKDSFYFDLTAYLDGRFSCTPAVSLMRGLLAATELLLAEGEQARLKRFRLLSRMARAAGEALGMRPLAGAAVASPTVTTLMLPEGLTEQEVRGGIHDAGVDISGGLGPMQGKAIRIGHVGYIYPEDMAGGISALEVALARIGRHPGKLGSAVTAALECWAEAGVPV